ncbi:hypothetical protein [Mesorhizobium sp.]|uniref:hypothetical protein n=1 Tax=Mesorhizobium sp. TaxID=1871066 RepID=UPI00257E28BF|nr:hypothetical protein [Mesorhizobium sp.]
MKDYQAELPSAVVCFMEDFEAAVAHLRMPITHRRAIRTTNLLGRLFVEERRRLKIIPNTAQRGLTLNIPHGAPRDLMSSYCRPAFPLVPALCSIASFATTTTLFDAFTTTMAESDLS